ncbi:hypothetical protein BR93DRAFT_911433 [Coniochaeta sp. PMI_546]|nr:hypothetical protein BR93DRAFT_911433 [Coniochaeta sp. PMI_546]
MSTRIPPLLEPYLALPPETSLIVLTSILGASTNWLVLRYLHTFLNPSAKTDPAPSPDDTVKEDVSVLLVSFLRDYPFWRDGAGRLGVDLEAAGRKGKFAFVDGLTALYLPPGEAKSSSPWQVRLTSHRLGDVRRTLHAAVDGMMAKGAGRKTHATVMTLSADEPLVAGQTTTLEKEHAALVLSAAHEAEIVLSLRLLDTGTAKDVSGVVRITRGGGESSRAVEEKEYLYHVLGDGGVRVFERGQ